MPHINQDNQTKNVQDMVPHEAVLLAEVIDILAPKKGQEYLDLTAGYGGHAKSVLETILDPGKMTLVDRDLQAIEFLKREFPQTAAIIHSDFLSASRELAGHGRQFDMILADLGASSPHFDKPERGFTFSDKGPLDMRMDQSQALSAQDLVNGLKEEKLARILREYGEEPKARSIARAIVAARPISDTRMLARIVAKAVGGRKKARIHPATRTFQALRIAVNDELTQLEAGLPLWMSLLKPGGRLAIISFHSLEDRIVKNFLAEHAADTYDAELTSLTKKPITASQDEIVSNPRARSAKLRAAAKIKNQKKG